MSRITYGSVISETGTPLQNNSPSTSTAVSSTGGIANYELVFAAIADIELLKRSVTVVENEVKRIKPIHVKQNQFLNTLTVVCIIAFIFVMLLLVVQCIVFYIFLKEYYPNSITTNIVNIIMGGVSFITILELLYSFGYIRNSKSEYSKLSEKVAKLEESFSKEKN